MEFKCCKICEGKNGTYPEGFIVNKDGSITECQCHIKYVRDKQVKVLYKNSGFDLRHFDYSPRQYVGTNSIEDKNRLINYVNNFSKSEKVRQCIVYMYGKNGCQKTTLASWVGKSLIEQGYRVKLILMNNLIKLLMDAEDFNAEKAEKAKAELDKINKADLLIIDEAFDKSKVKLYKTGYMDSFLDSFTRDRIQTLNKGIIFISNVIPEQIEENGFSHSLQDFVIREVTPYNNVLEFTDNYIQSSNFEFSGGSLF